MVVKLFGMLAEKAGTSDLDLQVSDLASLRAALRQRIDGLDNMSYAIAVDRRIVKEDRSFTGNEEIAVLPPFAGG